MEPSAGPPLLQDPVWTPFWGGGGVVWNILYVLLSYYYTYGNKE